MADSIVTERTRKKAGNGSAEPKAGGAKRRSGKAAAGNNKAPEPANEKAPAKVTEPKVSQAELDSLRKAVENANGRLEKAKAESAALTDKARALVADAKDAYQTALMPYREACRKAGVECEFEGGRGRNVSEKVSFEVEKVADGVRVTVKGRPETEEVIPAAALKESVNKASYAYTDKHLGNKGGSLSNRLRALLPRFSS